MSEKQIAVRNLAHEIAHEQGWAGFSLNLAAKVFAGEMTREAAVSEYRAHLEQHTRFNGDASRVTHVLVMTFHEPPPPRDGHVYRAEGEYVHVCAEDFSAYGFEKSILTHPHPVVGCGAGWLGLQARLWAEARGIECAELDE